MDRGGKMQYINVTILKEQYRQMKSLSLNTMIPLTALMRRAVKDFLQGQKPELLKNRKVQVMAEKQDQKEAMENQEIEDETKKAS